MWAAWKSNTKICTTDLRQGPVVFFSLTSIKDLDFLILFLTLKRLRFPPLWLKINTKRLLSLCCSEKPCCKSSLHLPACGYNASWKASSDRLCVGLSLPFETMETNYVLHKQRQPSINILHSLIPRVLQYFWQTCIWQQSLSRYRAYWTLFITDKQAEQLSKLLLVMMMIQTKQKEITVKNSLSISVNIYHSNTVLNSP